MIKSFKHGGLEKFFKTGSKAGIQPPHAKKLTAQLTALNVAKTPQDMNVPSWKLHELKSDEAGTWSIWVNGNYRMTFGFEGTDAVLVDYRDYH